MRRASGVIGLMSAVTAVLLACLPGAPAQAGTRPTATAAAGAASRTASGAVVLSAIRLRARITFDKNWVDPSDSRLTWRVVHQDDNGVWRVVDQQSWRAGSGMLGRRGRNECAKGRGWLPNGTYRLRYHPDYDGTLIKGRAFRLDDHRCHNGRTRRVQLFIHSEQGLHDVQCADAPGDQVCRWEYPEINDYRSAGCIKLAPADLADLSAHFRQFFRAGVRYARARVALRVVA